MRTRRVPRRTPAAVLHEIQVKADANTKCPKGHYRTLDEVLSDACGVCARASAATDRIRARLRTVLFDDATNAWRVADDSVGAFASLDEALERLYAAITLLTPDTECLVRVWSTVLSEGSPLFAATRIQGAWDRRVW